MSADEPSLSLSITPTELATCIKVLSKFNDNDKYPTIESNEYIRIRPLIHNLYHTGKQYNQKKNKDHHSRIKPTIQKAKILCLPRPSRPKKIQFGPIFVPQNAIQIDDHESNTLQSNSCHICRLKYETLHFFYAKLCPLCAELNYKKRLQTTDLTNHIALVTGGRVNIGYRIVLKLLRANCFVITTSRFPIDCLNRLSKEQDFEQWKNRLHIYGIDFRYSQLVELFTEMLINTYDRLDFLINNACQVIQRSNEFHQHLINNEKLINYSRLPNDQQNILDGNLQFYKRLVSFSDLSQDTSSSSDLLSLPDSNDTIEPISSIIKTTLSDEIDLHSTKSYLLRLDDISSNEINDVFAINTLAPFVLTSKLKILMTLKHPNPDSLKFIINVTAMDGVFSHSNKTDRHPHTNAAKAALNMMTRTSGTDYQRSNIYMISVDTGWINEESSLENAMEPMIHRDSQTSLDDEDAAARVLDPIIDTYRQLAEGKTDIDIPFGRLLKDYCICNW